MWTLEGLVKHNSSVQVQINGKWVPARPLPTFGLRIQIREAWAVLRGKASAFTWPEGQ